MQKEEILVIQVKCMLRTFFAKMNFDSVTINPYMGSDSVKPFLEFENKIFYFIRFNLKYLELKIFSLKKTNNDYVFI